MSGNIIGMGAQTAVNPAPASVLGSLYKALVGNTGPRFYVINGYGEALGPSATRPWTVTGQGSVSDFVRGGGIFVDYTGWPMYNHIDVDGATTLLGPAGFQQFAGAIGYDWLSAEQFAVPASILYGSFGSDKYPFSRGYAVSGSQAGVYLSQGTFSTPGGILGIGGGTWPLHAQGFAGMFGLHHSGIGWYFYATATPNAVSASMPSFVPPAVFASFILACLNGQSNGDGFTVSRLAYQAPYQSSPPSQSFPSSPYPSSASGGGSSSSSTGSGSGSSINPVVTGTGTSTSTSTSTGGGTSTTVPTVSPASTPAAVPKWLLPLGGALLLGGGAWLGLEAWWARKGR